LYISSNKIASKIIDLFANNHITQNQWKFDIPDDITDENMAIIATAKNFADGINYSLDRRGIDIPAKLIVASSEYRERITSEGEIIGY
jgi:hypothetical protein